MAVEFEIKFRATPEQLNAVRSAALGQTQEFQMETTYYDTPNGDLSARKYTLRRRMENDRSVCTLKTPAQNVGRNEFETDSPSIEEAIPVLCKLSGLKELPALLSDGVVPLCGAKFCRTAVTVVRKDCTVEIALDQGILSGGGKTIPLCELEVELKDGSQAGALAYAEELRSAYGLTRERASKFQRARALAKGDL